MSRNRTGLLTAVILVGIGLAVCLGTWYGPAPGGAGASVNPVADPPGRSATVDVAIPPLSLPASEEGGCVSGGGSNPDAGHDSSSRTKKLAEVIRAPRPIWAESHPSVAAEVQPPPGESALLDLLGALKERLDADAGHSRADSARGAGDASQPPPIAPPSAETTVSQAASPSTTGRVDDLGNQRFELHFQNDDIRLVLEAISEHAGLNIIVSDSVQGNVTANFVDVDVLAALDAMLKSTGFLARREGSFLYVGTPEDFTTMEQTLDRLSTRIYRPNYVTASELQSLITPLLTEGLGLVSISSEAEVGIAPDSGNVGGNKFAGDEVLLVRDYTAVLDEINQIVDEVDIRPQQVAIEAMILSVKLDDQTKMGVSFDFLRQNPNIRFGIGTPPSTLPTDLNKGGLQFAFLDSNLGAFVDALESIQDTNIIATPRVLVLNKHRAEVQIGKQEGYVTSTSTETSTTQSVDFLDTGTLLRIRPFISKDGLIRMELHPELSSGQVKISENFTIPSKEVTQVTTNIMVRDGCTVIIGGLIREQLDNGVAQVPLLGSLPFVGPVFRSKQNQATIREEILILLTPHILREPEAHDEGDQAAGEFHRRRDVMAEKSTPLSRDHLSRRYFRLAQNAWVLDDHENALRYAELAVHFNPGNRAAIDLRSDIWMNEAQGGHSLLGPRTLPQRMPTAMVPDGEELPTWVIQGLQEDTSDSSRPSAQSGEAASSKSIKKPGGWR
jgi:type IV pilus assembly protein PilQ